MKKRISDDPIGFTYKGKSYTGAKSSAITATEPFEDAGAEAKVKTLLTVTAEELNGTVIPNHDFLNLDGDQAGQSWEVTSIKDSDGFFVFGLELCTE